MYTTKALHTAAVATADGVIVDLADVSGGVVFANVAVQVKGITTAVITCEATIDGTNWVGVAMTSQAAATSAATITADGIYRNTGVLVALKFRARISAWTSGATTVTALASTEV